MVLSMDRWVGKVAVVTGASAGIGAAIAKQLVENGMKVVGFARRVEKVEHLAKSLQGEKGQLYAVQCDVREEEDIINAFQWVNENLGPIYVLVNNAGVLQNTSLSDGETDKWRSLLDTNVVGLCIATREAIRIMKSNNIAGHIVNLNSILGHSIPALFAGLNMYPASKHAVTALTESLRLELAQDESGIKVTSISPGATESEIVQAAGMEPDNFSAVFVKNRILLGEDIADAVTYALSTPLHVQIKELTIKPVGEKF